jgi:hypothetical protein
MGSACRKNGERRNAYRILGGNRGQRPLGRPRRGWVDNIKMGLIETGRGRMDWTDLAQNRNRWRALGNMTMKNFGKLLSSCTTGN